MKAELWIRDLHDLHTAVHVSRDLMGNNSRMSWMISSGTLTLLSDGTASVHLILFFRLVIPAVHLVLFFGLVIASVHLILFFGLVASGTLPTEIVSIDLINNLSNSSFLFALNMGLGRIYRRFHRPFYKSDSTKEI